MSDTLPPTILTVCTGNICRSPMAEVLLKDRLSGIDVRVHSAGTHAPVGRGMPEIAQEIAVRHGASPSDVAAHIARWLDALPIEDTDLVLAMTREHRSAVVEVSPSLLRRMFTVREFARLSAGLSDEDVRAAADAAGSDARQRLAGVVARVSAQRGNTVPASADDDDVIDPYHRGREVYEESVTQLVPAVDEVARVLRTALVAS